MSEAQKSKRALVLESVINASNKKEAVEAIKFIMESLHITGNYQSMFAMGEDMEAKSAEVAKLQREHLQMPTPRNHEAVQEMRTKANFLYREIVDLYVKSVVSLKKVLEEEKRVVEIDAIEYVRDNPETFKDVNKSNIRGFIGGAPVFKKWLKDNAVAYANYKYLERTLEATKAFVDSLASELRSLGNVEQNDVK